MVKLQKYLTPNQNYHRISLFCFWLFMNDGVQAHQRGDSKRKCNMYECVFHNLSICMKMVIEIIFLCVIFIFCVHGDFIFRQLKDKTNNVRKLIVRLSNNSKQKGHEIVLLEYKEYTYRFNHLENVVYRVPSAMTCYLKKLISFDRWGWLKVLYFSSNWLKNFSYRVDDQICGSQNEFNCVSLQLPRYK